MAIHVDAATEERFRKALAQLPEPDPSALMNHLLDVEQERLEGEAAFRSELDHMLEESHAQFERGEGISAAESRARIAALRARAMADQAA